MLYLAKWKADYTVIIVPSSGTSVSTRRRIQDPCSSLALYMPTLCRRCTVLVLPPLNMLQVVNRYTDCNVVIVPSTGTNIRTRWRIRNPCLSLMVLLVYHNDYIDVWVCWSYPSITTIIMTLYSVGIFNINHAILNQMKSRLHRHNRLIARYQCVYETTHSGPMFESCSLYANCMQTRYCVGFPTVKHATSSQLIYCLQRRNRPIDRPQYADEMPHSGPMFQSVGPTCLSQRL